MTERKPLFWYDSYARDYMRYQRENPDYDQAVYDWIVWMEAA